MDPASAPLETQLDQTFAVLAHPIRRDILTRLSREGTATVTELAEAFPVSVMAISKHLKRMDEAGLIRREKAGRVRRCSVEPAGLEPAREWLDEHRRFWESQLDALSAYLGDPDHDPPPHNREQG